MTIIIKSMESDLSAYILSPSYPTLAYIDSGKIHHAH